MTHTKRSDIFAGLLHIHRQLRPDSASFG